MPKILKLVLCPLCRGDGKETCDNPDHGFISRIGGEIGRLGCPGCGHDPNHKVPNGGSCELCFGGNGLVDLKIAERYAQDRGLTYADFELG